MKPQADLTPDQQAAVAAVSETKTEKGGTPPPSPDELKEEMDKIRACHEMIRKARTETDKRRKKLLEPPIA